jgi:hypothetical protein
MAAERLRFSLDAWEESIQRDIRELAAQGIELVALPGPRAARTWVRKLDLTDGLEAIAAARVELDKYPEGAALAEAVLTATLHRLRLDVDYGKGRYQDGLDGANAPRRKRAEDEHAQIRARAAKLDPDLSVTAKAKILARAGEPGERQIRRILSK